MKSSSLATLAAALLVAACGDVRDQPAPEPGDRFDVRRFHTEILKDGAMPLSMLEQEIDQWLETQG